MGRLSPLVPLAVLTIALYGVVISFHNLFHDVVRGPSNLDISWDEELESVFAFDRNSRKLLGYDEEPPKAFSWDTVCCSELVDFR